MKSIADINAANAAFWARRNAALAKLMQKKPAAADIKAGHLRTVRRVLNESETIRQANEPKLHRLMARLRRHIDDSNISAYRGARRLLKESNAPARLRLARAKAGKQTRAAAAGRRKIGNDTRERILKAAPTSGTLRARAGSDAVEKIGTSYERARKVLAERSKK